MSISSWLYIYEFFMTDIDEEYNRMLDNIDRIYDPGRFMKICRSCMRKTTLSRYRKMLGMSDREQANYLDHLESIKFNYKLYLHNSKIEKALNRI